MIVYLCALAKNEHYYINEWVSHYLKLGVDKIFLYDNDDKNAPQVRDFIDKENLAKMKIINARGLHWDKMHHDLFTNFYRIQRDNFDWCIFCDIDEFLVGTDNIKSFLSQPKFNLTKQIRVKWKLYGDDDIIVRDKTLPVLNAFTKEITKSLSNDLSREVNLQNQGKAIVRGHLKDIVFHSPHYAQYMSKPQILPSMLPSGKICSSGVAIKENYQNEKLFFNHYMTKSLSEFIEQKMNRTDAVFGERQLKLNYFWRINEKTKEKIKYLKDMGLFE